MAGTRANQHQVPRLELREKPVGRRRCGSFRREHAPCGKAFRRGDAVERIVQRNAFLAGQALCSSLQTIDGCRQSHRKNLPLRAETQPLLMPGARTVGPMINSPCMRSTFPAEGGGVGDTESSVADSALAENERG